jgi:hypothetical protein
MTGYSFQPFNLQVFIYFFTVKSKVNYKYNQLYVKSIIRNVPFIMVIRKVIIRKAFISIVIVYSAHSKKHSASFFF